MRRYRIQETAEALAEVEKIREYLSDKERTIGEDCWRFALGRKLRDFGKDDRLRIGIILGHYCHWRRQERVRIEGKLQYVYVKPKDRIADVVPEDPPAATSLITVEAVRAILRKSTSYVNAGKLIDKICWIDLRRYSHPLHELIRKTESIILKSNWEATGETV